MSREELLAAVLLLAAPQLARPGRDEAVPAKGAEDGTAVGGELGGVATAGTAAGEIPACQDLLLPLQEVLQAAGGVPHVDLLAGLDVSLGHHLHPPLLGGDDVPGVPDTAVIDQREGREESSTPVAGQAAAVACENPQSSVDILDCEGLQ